MEAKGSCISILDVLKIIARKWLRLAPAYYIMWLFLWGVTARIGEGAFWNVSDMGFHTCGEHWWSSALMIGNLYPKEMPPFDGCYNGSWPL